MPDRIIPFYRPRELLDASLCQSAAGLHLLCVSDSQLYILRRLLSYAHREIQFVWETYENNTYTTPSASVLDNIQAVVDDLEDKLMADCNDLLVAVQCICTQLSLLRQSTVASGILEQAQELIDDGYYSWDTPPDVGVSQEEELACGLAQAHWAAMFESWTEVWRPGVSVGFDKILPAAATAIFIMTGGTGLIPILAVYFTAEQIQAFLQVVVEGTLENVTNWLLADKDEIICASFEALFGGGSEADAIAAVNAVIDASEEISAGEKAFFHLVNYFGYRVAKIAQDEDSTWYGEVVVPGYCAICNPWSYARWSFYEDNALFDAQPNACPIGSYADMPYHYVTSDPFQLPLGAPSETAQVRIRGYINQALWDFPPAPGDCIIRVILKESDDVIEFFGSDFPLAGFYNILREIPLTGTVARVDFQMQGTNAVCTGWWIMELSVHALAP